MYSRRCFLILLSDQPRFVGRINGHVSTFPALHLKGQQSQINLPILIHFMRLNLSNRDDSFALRIGANARKPNALGHRLRSLSGVVSGG
jgi:hypothetical protein